MLPDNYESHQLIPIVESLLNQKTTGILSLQTDIISWKKQRLCNLILRNGKLIFGSSQIPNNEQLCKTLGEQLNSNTINAALLVAKQRISNQESYQEFIDLLIKMKVFTWEDVKLFINNSIVLNLEPFLSKPGRIKWQTIDNFDLFTGEEQDGLNWSDIQQRLDRRQEKWHALTPSIPQMDAIPIVRPEQLEQIDDVKVQKHLANSADGYRNLLDIAEKMDQDPLKVAKTYFKWFKNGWVSFETVAKTHQDLPIVLSLDDSPIVQTMIKRSLEGICQVMLTDDSTSALEILHEHPVQMLLLDLTMPDVDGLDFCQAIRKVSKFHDLPIVMLTARDGLVNRAKGHFAGTNKYLTKPFKAQELREVVGRYIDI